MDYKLTDEQQAAVDLFTSGENLVIEAGAGSGKTSTLVAIAESTDRKGNYHAFTKAIVVDSGKRMPATVTARTMHSLAYGSIIGRSAQFKARLLSSERLSRTVEASILDVGAFRTDSVKGARTLAAGYLAGYVMEGITRFCHSADPEPLAKHLPTIDFLDPPNERGHHRGPNNRALAEAHLIPLRRAWRDLTNPEGRLRFSHDHYLKMYQLSDPTIAVDFILFDEAQDANPVMAAILDGQAEWDTQLVYVGDSAQCQPDGTMVTVVESYRRGNRHTGILPTTYRQVPIEEVEVGDVVTSFDVGRSFLRRTGSRVTATQARPFEGHLTTVTTPGGLSSRYTPNHRCVVRFGDAFDGKWAVYLMRRVDSYRIGMVKGIYGSESIGLTRRALSEGADEAWVLSLHDTEEAARLAEAKAAWGYGIPDLGFRAGTRSTMTQDSLDEVWGRFSGHKLSERAEECLLAHGRDIRYPLYTRGRRLHRNRSQIVHAANLLDGMLVLPMANALDADGKQVARKRWEPVTVEREFYSGTVHSLDVEGDETYVADGIVTHNSIFGFTGAINAMERMEGNRTFLTKSFRFGQPVADLANDLLAELGTELRVVGNEQIHTAIGSIETPQAVVTRTNAKAIAEALDFMSAGKKVSIADSLKNAVTSFARAAQQLQNTGSCSHRELAPFASWEEVREFVREDLAGHELQLMVGLVDKFGVPTILSGLQRTTTERQADVVLSTAHTAKGREWSSVRLADDFPVPEPDEPLPADELRLLYVAATRAIHALDVSQVARFNPALMAEIHATRAARDAMRSKALSPRGGP